MWERFQVYLEKADESINGAVSELANGRFNNCANRAYYACFQAAVHALGREGITPSDAHGKWGHDFVQAAFIGQLINRRKLYPSSLREVLLRNYTLRETGDYKRDQVNEVQATRAVRRAEEFIEAIRQRGGDV